MSEAMIEKVFDKGSQEDIDRMMQCLSEANDDVDAAWAKFQSSDNSGARQVLDPEPGTLTPPEPIAPPAPAPIVAAPAPAPIAPVAATAAIPAPAPASVVQAKDGIHTIPFSELQSARETAEQLRAQLAEQSRQTELLKKQLEDSGMKPKDLPENVTFTDEELAEFESFGAIGEAVATVARQNAALREQLAKLGGGTAPAPAVAPAPTPAAPVVEAGMVPSEIAFNGDLVRWWQDPETWSVVQRVELAVIADPKWAGKSLPEYTGEIVKRVKTALGELTQQEIDAAAAVALQGAQARIPTSLTEIGGEVPGSTKSLPEQLESATDAQIEEKLQALLSSGLKMDEAMARMTGLR